MEKVIIILLFFCLLITFPFPFELRASFNVKKNFGTLSAYCGLIRFNLSKLTIKGNQLLIKTKKKRIEKEFALSTDNFDFAKNFSKSLFKKISFRKIGVYSHVGLKDPFKSAIVFGGYETLVILALLKFKTLKPNSQIDFASKTDFLENKLMFAVKMTMFITPLDLLIGYIKAIIITKKERKYVDEQRGQSQQG